MLVSIYNNNQGSILFTLELGDPRNQQRNGNQDYNFFFAKELFSLTFCWGLDYCNTLHSMQTTELYNICIVCRRLSLPE